MSQDTTMRRSDIARRTGIHLETVRYYEKIGILPPPPRNATGHRRYNGEHERRLNFVKRARELGFTLDEVRGLLCLVDTDTASCNQVRGVAETHIGSIRAKINDLRKIEDALKSAVERCNGGETPNCAVLDVLGGVREPALEG